MTTYDDTSMETSREVPARPDPVDTSRADAEIVRHFSTAATAVMEDDLDGFGRHAGRAVALTAEAQIELALSFQRGRWLAAEIEAGRIVGGRARKARAEIARSEEHGEHLMGSVFKLIRKVVWQNGSARLGRDWAAAELPDLLSEGTIAAMEAAATFDPAREVPFAQWVSAQVARRMQELDPTPGGGTRSRTWQRVARIAHGLIPDLTQELGHTPSIPELQDALLARCRRHIADNLSAEERLLGAEDRDRLIHARLSRQGFPAAIAELPAVLASGETPSSFDYQVGDGDATFGDVVAAPAADDDGEDDASLLRRVLATMPEQDMEIVLARFGMRDGTQWTYERVAKEFDVDALTVRRVVHATVARVTAPHAQFCALADLATQFEEAPVLPSALLVRRLAAAA